MRLLTTPICLICVLKLWSQPYADIVNFNYFHFNSTYQDSLQTKNETRNYTLSLFYPKEFKNGNTLLVRTGGEYISTGSPESVSEGLYSVSMGLGYQVLSSNKKWKYLLMGIPKVSFTKSAACSNENLHYSAIGLITYAFSGKLKFKAGLYYSKEFFGNFYVPLASVEWKINNHWSTYGVLPSNYRIEYRFNNKLYTGLNFKSYTRSFLISPSLGYIKDEEMQLKLFLDYFLAKNILVYAEFGRTLGYKILAFDDSDIQQNYLKSFKDNFFFSAGLAYRIRLDLE